MNTTTPALTQQEKSAPTQPNATYMLFTADHDQADAMACFIAVYHQQPEIVRRGANNQLWVGPVPASSTRQEKSA